MPRASNPDGVVDADYGSGTRGSKSAEYLNEDVYNTRAEDRAGLRDLDAMVESSVGMTRQQRDRERATPRETNAELKHPAMERKLPAPDEVRKTLSSRQRKARSIAKHAAQDRFTQTQYDTVARVITDDGEWRQINDVLSENTGDAQALTDQQRTTVQRLDRAIQNYERENDRGHVVYANVEMPTMINSSNLEGFVRNNFQRGAVIEFDRFTGGAHTMHEVEVGSETAHRTAVFEIQTRRGVYLGKSDSSDDTTHVLPRAMRMKIAGTHWARYERPDGSEGRRQVIQLIDVGDQPNDKTEK